MNIEHELTQIGLTIRRTDHGAQGPEGRLDCPFCPSGPSDARTKDPALAVNLESGAWHCHRCNERGNLFLLRRRLRGEPAQIFHAARTALTKSVTAPTPGRVIEPATVEAMRLALFGAEGAGALRYLRETRKLSDEIMRRFKFGFAKRSTSGAVAIPYLAGDRCLGVKYRLLPPGDAQRKYDREPGCILPLFNTNALVGEYRSVVVTEGEFDAVALTQYGVGVPVVSIPDGATSGLKDDAASALEHFDEILLALDQDAKGDEGAAKLAERLGAFRCQRVKLPAKDGNDCLATGVSREVLLSALASASPCCVSAVQHISSWREELTAEPTVESRGLCTGWRGLDMILGGLRPGEVSLLTAETGSGKTTWTLDLIRRQAANGHAALVASLEIPTRAVARKLLSGVAGGRWDLLGHAARSTAVDQLCALPIYLLERYGEVPVPQLVGEIEIAVRRYGVVIAVIDHIHFALGVRRAGDDERALIDMAAQAIQSAALRLGIHVVLVMHPAKIRADDHGRIRQPEIGDLKGSSGPAQFADNVFRISRSEDNRAVLALLKVRSELGGLGHVAFAFDPDSLRFRDLDAVEINPPDKPKRRSATKKEPPQEPPPSWQDKLP